ncbi:MAG TPA: hypothetical protein VKP65_11625 [Rhodothermales bacterium]|nr:hypothetical protein [Rhodothermales bacterium]
MTPVPRSFKKKALTPVQALLFGTLTVGVLDILDALVFFGLRGVPPIRIFQSIASGLLGRAAFSGGLATAALGGVLHFFIAFVIVTVYYLASRWLSPLAQRPLLSGPLYGVFVYAIMTFVVVPLSAASSGPLSLAVLINGLLIHVVGVGLPSALFARAASASRSAPPSSVAS